MSASPDDRGQTAVDFLAGMGVLLIAVLFVLAFVPSMFAPFFGMGVGDALAADRGAAHLVEGELGADTTVPAILNASAVEDFFAGDYCDPASGESLADELGLQNTASVNVTIGDDQWVCGDEPADRETVSRRIVSIDGEQHTLRVVVW